MPSPTFLGVAAAGAQDSPLSPGASGSLVLTTTLDMPRKTAVGLLIVQWAPFSQNGLAELIPALTITDDAPDPADGVAPNSYHANLAGGSGGLAYNFGGVSVIPGGFDAGTFDELYPCGFAFTPYNVGLSRGLPAGSEITIAFTTSPSSVGLVYLRATLLAFTPAGLFEMCVGARTIDPANTEDGNHALIPLGDHTFSEFANTDAFVALVAAGDGPSGTLGPPYNTQSTIDGSETADDPSGNWTKVDSGSSADSDADGGYVSSIFVCDGATVDPAQPIDQFQINPGGLSAFGDVYALLGVMQYGGSAQPLGTPAAVRVFPA